MRTEIFADTKAGRAIEVTFYEYDCDGEISELGGPVRTPNAEHFCGVIFHSERKRVLRSEGALGRRRARRVRRGVRLLPQSGNQRNRHPRS